MELDEMGWGALAGGFGLPVLVTGFGGSNDMIVAALIVGVVGGGLASPVGSLVFNHRYKKQAEAAKEQAAKAQEVRLAEAKLGQLAKERELKARQLQQAQEARARQVEDDKRRQLAMVSTVGDSARAAVLEYFKSAERLDAVPGDISQARQHFERHAYTPFWESVEAAVSGLVSHRQAIAAVTQHSIEYTARLRNLAGRYPELCGTVVPFPNELENGEAIAAGNQLSESLNDLVYEAHTDFNFAAIHEQRRTTSAVVSGFRSLSEAVFRMSDAMTTGYRELGAAINEVRLTVASVGYTQSNAIEQLETSTTRAAAETARAFESATHTPLLGGGDTLGGQVVEINRHLEQLARSAR